METGRGVIIVDIQNDFCEGGVLAAKDTESLIQPVNDFTHNALKTNTFCVFTRDWHPVDHISFTSEGGPWPPHCVQGSIGAEFANGLIIPESSLVKDLKKDIHRNEMGYSAFQNTNLAKILHEKGITELCIIGIATDYCVKETVLDALKNGFGVNVLTDLIRPVELNPGDSDRAIAEMKTAGAELMSSRDYSL